uniref:Uncharacterized protein n=1 Tax=Salmonella phage PMBT27 TaxID=3137285 RepID=A0AAU8BUH3_9VIRU
MKSQRFMNVLNAVSMTNVIGNAQLVAMMICMK